MNLKSKKQLAAKTLGVGKRRIYFNPENLSDIKEAITKQDIKTLYDEGIIRIKPEKGRRKIKRRKTKKGSGKIRIKIKTRKRDYVRLTRKLRRYLKEMKNLGEIDKETYYSLRTKIKMKSFKSKAHFKEYIENLKKEAAEEKTSKKSKRKIEKKPNKKIENKSEALKRTRKTKEKKE